MQKDYTALFNGLSMKGQLTLKAAATFDSLTDFIREDTKLHPWRFPFYALFMSAIIIPVPVFGIPAAIAGGAVLCAKYKVGGIGKRLNTHLADVFQNAAMAERYENYITPSRDNSGIYEVHPWALAKHSARLGWKNGKAAAGHAYNSIKEYF
jgi:hypothetical protein